MLGPDINFMNIIFFQERKYKIKRAQSLCTQGFMALVLELDSSQRMKLFIFSTLSPKTVILSDEGKGAKVDLEIH